MKFFYFLIALVAGAILAWIIKDQHGYLLIAWDKTTVEMRLWLACFLFVIYSFGLFIISWLMLTLKRSGRRVKRWTVQRGSQKSRSQTINGLIALTEGHFEKAEQWFQKANLKSDSRLINYLLAAKAAQEQGNFRARDLYLQKASEWEPDANIAVSVTQAELQFEGRQYEQALATLAQLWSQHKRHPYVIKLLAKCYIKLADWNGLYQLLPSLKKQTIFQPNEYFNIENRCLIELLNSAAQSGPEALQNQWQKFSNDYQKRAELVQAFAQHLIAFGAQAEAEAILRQQLKRRYQPELIHIYGQAYGRDVRSQLAFAESFKEQGSRDWQCLLALGQLSYFNELWGKANAYLMQAIALHPSLEVLSVLLEVRAQLEESMDETLLIIKDVISQQPGQKPAALPFTGAE
ncbi:MAG: hypothetical protein HWE11_11140 [Gammaproteobacteria bacterium]|nr:hypothetical protein [Gammaproteobacteria bacterium]